MEDFLVRFGAYILLTIVAGIIAYFVRSIKQQGDLDALPEPRERLRLLNEIRNLKAGHKNHAACLEHLLGQGLRKGVAEGLLIDVEREQPPDIETVNIFKWNDWSCSYPGNWQEISVNKNIPKDMATGIEGIGSASIIFFKTSNDSLYESILSEQLATLKDVEESLVDEWGPLKGEGTLIQGTFKVHNIPMEVTVFYVTDAPVPFIIIENCAIEEKELISPGFNLIRSTFVRGKSVGGGI